SPWPIERAVYSGPKPCCLPARLDPQMLAESDLFRLAPPSILHPDLRLPDHRAPFVNFRLQEVCQFGWCRAFRGGAEFLEPRLDRWMGEAALVSALILATMSCGVLAGTKKPNHDITSKPGTPCSAMVGMS